MIPVSKGIVSSHSPTFPCMVPGFINAITIPAITIRTRKTLFLHWFFHLLNSFPYTYLSILPPFPSTVCLFYYHFVIRVLNVETHNKCMSGWPTGYCHFIYAISISFCFFNSLWNCSFYFIRFLEYACVIGFCP